jgi:hypothetical protein
MVHPTVASDTNTNTDANDNDNDNTNAMIDVGDGRRRRRPITPRTVYTLVNVVAMMVIVVLVPSTASTRTTTNSMGKSIPAVAVAVAAFSTTRNCHRSMRRGVSFGLTTRTTTTTTTSRVVKQGSGGDSHSIITNSLSRIRNHRIAVEKASRDISCWRRTPFTNGNNDDDDEYEDDDDADDYKHVNRNQPSRVLPQLSASSRSIDDDSIGLDDSSVLNGQSFSSSLTNLNGDSKNQTLSTTAAFVTPKFELQYTCNVCETKNRVIVSRLAYREGLVIAICKGCQTKHWIADNLDPTLVDTNIEEYFTRLQQQQQQQQGVGGGGALEMEIKDSNAATVDGGSGGNTNIDREQQQQQRPQQVNRVSQDVYELERVLEFTGTVVDENGNTVLE